MLSKGDRTGLNRFDAVAFLVRCGSDAVLKRCGAVGSYRLGLPYSAM